MIYFLAIVWVLSAVVLLRVRFNSLSVALLACLIYSLPAFWSGSSGLPELIWVIVLLLVISGVLLFRNCAQPAPFHVKKFSPKVEFCISTFNVLNAGAFVVIVLLSRGISVFFQGKYGETPGGSLTVYYAWNSLLIVTASINLASRRLTSPWNLFCVIELLLLFVAGDRTLPSFYLFALLRSRLSGIRPVSLFRGKGIAVSSLYLALAPLALVSKSIYTLLPEYGFSTRLFAKIFSVEYFQFVVRDFEPSHTYRILIYATSGRIDYEPQMLFVGLLSFLPASSYLGIDPHLFSNAIKSAFFPTWGDAAGVGANFWAQGWVVGGVFGVAVFAAFMVMLMWFCDRSYRRAATGLGRGTVLLMTAVFGFYVQRNSMEQILSFSGRYLTIFFMVMSVAILIWTVSPKKQRSA